MSPQRTSGRISFDLVTFGTEVLSVAPEPADGGAAGANGWRVMTSRGDEGVFDGVVVANGHSWDPYMPSVPGEFANHNYPGMPAPEATTIADGPVTVNDLLLYWVHHGRVALRPGLSRFDGNTVHFTDGTLRSYDAILWATGFNVSLPFLDPALIGWRQNVPLRYAGGILPEGAERLYFAGLIAPRGTQIPIYGQQAKLIAGMLALHETAGPRGAGLAAYFAKVQEPETRIDIVRTIWNDQMTDTARLFDALEAIPAHLEGASS